MDPRLYKLIAQCKCVQHTRCILACRELNAMFETCGIKRCIDKDTIMLYANADELDVWVNIEYLKERVAKLFV